MKSLQEREEEFRRHVYDVGGTLYTKKMLDLFSDKWTEPDRGKRTKMRFEKEKTWRTSGRLATWARNNYDKIKCLLSEEERTSQIRRRDFANSLQPFLKEYGREMLNRFYAYWSQPNEGGYLRWEDEDFWELETRLQEWKTRNERMVNHSVR